MSELIINKEKSEKAVKIAIIENGKISEMCVQNGENDSTIGNVYVGIVENVVDGMQAAFVNIGIEKNAFLSVKDALPKVDVAKEELNIDKKMSEILKVGDKLLVQVRKEPSDKKGARVSTHITLPGNYIVLMPETKIITVSQKIEPAQEIERLKKIAKETLPENFGVIIRTDAENVDEETIKNDINEVLEKWYAIKKESEAKEREGIVYNDHDIVQKVLRDMVNKHTEKIFVNDVEIYENLKSVPTKKVDSIEFVDASSIFEKFGLVTELENMENRKSWLKCGGYIVIDKTEALTAIDVNSGKYTGSNNLEQTALSVNIEAAIEIMRQLRLKDIGGIIIIDYIDLENKNDQGKVIETMKKEALKDRSRIDIKGYTKLNLVELTRKKLYV